MEGVSSHVEFLWLQLQSTGSGLTTSIALSWHQPRLKQGPPQGTQLFPMLKASPWQTAIRHPLLRGWQA